MAMLTDSFIVISMIYYGNVNRFIYCDKHDILWQCKQIHLLWLTWYILPMLTDSFIVISMIYSGNVNRFIYCG